MSEKRTKMSKSKGNVVMVDEASRGVCGLSDRFEFRDLRGNLIDYKVMGVWRTVEWNYRTSTRTGRQPVFLHLVGEPVPPLVMGKIQHPEERGYWVNLLGLYEYVETVDTC